MFQESVHSRTFSGSEPFFSWGHSVFQYSREHQAKPPEVPNKVYTQKIIIIKD